MMKTIYFTLLLILMAIPQTVSAFEDVTDEYMDIINDYRDSIGLGELSLDEDMSEVARKHSKDMALGKSEFSHIGFSSRCYKSRQIMKKGNLCGEIIAYGQKSARRVFSAWMGSPGHRVKIEEERYSHTGFGFYKSSTGRIYWTQIFLEVE